MQKAWGLYLVYSTVRLLALPTEMSKQQPLTQSEYIVIPFGIVYIRSVSVVATCLFLYSNFARIWLYMASINNALRFLICLDILTNVNCKSTKKHWECVIFNIQKLPKALILTIMCRISGVFESKISTCLAFASLHQQKRLSDFALFEKIRQPFLRLENRSCNKNDKPPYANSKDRICNE